MWLWIPTVTNKETTLMTAGSAPSAQATVEASASAFQLMTKEMNAKKSDSHRQVFFWTHFKFAGHTMNQTAAKAINKERHYGNESVELVRSLSLRMLSHDSGQRFSPTLLIEGSIKEWGAEWVYLIHHTQTYVRKNNTSFNLMQSLRLWWEAHKGRLIFRKVWYLYILRCSWWELQPLTYTFGAGLELHVWISEYRPCLDLRLPRSHWESQSS